MLYSHSIAEIRSRITDRDSIGHTAKPQEKFFFPWNNEPKEVEDLDPTEMCSYLLWMCDNLETMTDPLQASRHIGWMYKAMGELDLMTLPLQRDCARADRQEVIDYTMHWVLSQ